MKILVSLMAWAVLLVMPAHSQSAASASTKFPVPNHGSLLIKVPDGWRTQTLPLSNPPSLTIHFTPASGDAFDIQVTAIWMDTAKRTSMSLEQMKTDTQRAGEELLPHSVEKVVTIHELRGPQSMGYYFSLTDRAPGPGEFSHLTQGTFLTGEILSAFTILHRTSDSPEVAQALQALAQAAFIK